MCTGSGEASRAGSGPLWIWQLGGLRGRPPNRLGLANPNWKPGVSGNPGGRSKELAAQQNATRLKAAGHANEVIDYLLKVGPSWPRSSAGSSPATYSGSPASTGWPGRPATFLNVIAASAVRIVRPMPRTRRRTRRNAFRP